jgi:hypothetical protein
MMTEEEWLTCADPAPALAFVRGTTTDRKLRLFACACCRRLQHLLSDKYSRRALGVAERFADGEVSEEKLRFAWGDAQRAAQVEYRQGNESAEAAAMGTVAEVCQADIRRVLAAVGVAARCEAYPDVRERFACAQREQAFLFREMVGNPFRPVAFDPAWRTTTALQLAQGIYDDRAFDRLPILADALQDAGCDSDDLLAHLRDATAPHVRGCWALDLVLEKM